MPVPVDAVWAALADPSGYEYWVVGSKVIRDAEPDFPAPGTKFHHTIGFGPLTLSDETEVLEAAPPTFLKLRAKGRPIGTARRPACGEVAQWPEQGTHKPSVGSSNLPLATLPDRNATTWMGGRHDPGRAAQLDSIWPFVRPKRRSDGF